MNQFGYQLAYDGVAYLGFGTYDINYKNYREYISIKLINKLTEKNKYCISAYVSLADNCSYGTNNLGFCFSENSVTGTAPNPINLTPQINFADRIFNNIIDWELIESEFIANGNEEFLTVGNFYNDSLTQFLVVDSSNFIGSYYYIDKIILYNCGEIIIPNVFTPNNDLFNDVWKCDFSGFENVNCFIYNRWGNLVFQSDKQIIQWNGRTTSGNECNDGIYFYCIETEKEKYKGHIQLIR